MKKFRSPWTGLALAGALILAGCGDGYSPPPPAEPPPPPEPVSFTQFVKDRFAATADDTDPEAVDDVDFAFDADDDPHAFDDLL